MNSLRNQVQAGDVLWSAEGALWSRFQDTRGAWAVLGAGQEGGSHAEGLVIW